LLYTDGLVERRDVSLEHGLARLRAAVTATNPETLCRTVMQHLVGTETINDDIALLAIRKSVEPAQA
jgi:serine phosphatase RsbU (regulator of sigma subunit)